MRRSVMPGVVLFAVLAWVGASLATPAAPPDSTAKWDHAASAQNIVIGRVVETHFKPWDSRSCIIDTRQFCRVEILDVLQGSMQPWTVVEGWFHGVGWGAGRRFAQTVGKLAVLFPETDGFHALMRVGDDLPGGGVLVLRDRNDPALERMRLAIRQASLDTLIARADVVCLGGYRYGQTTEFVVRRWIAGENPREVIGILHGEGEAGQPGKVLMFLTRDSRGNLQPVGNGRGELAVSRGRVVRFDRKLDDVLREICERRPCSTFVASAR